MNKTKKLILSVIMVICLFVWGVLTVFSIGKKNGLSDQNAAKRWSPEGDAAQISCFFTEGAEVDTDQIRAFEEQVNQKLTEASIVAVNENARLWMDAYSALGTITLTSEKTSLEAEAIGAGGDFFQFHPVQLINGAYFSGDDLMKDRIIVDEDAAWQLFGSNDIVGMKVQVGGTMHEIAGVIKRAEGHFNEAAGLNKTLIYVSYETLSELGVTEGINAYEIVMPNPVKDFAYTTVKEKFGLDEKLMWVVENTSRYGMKNLLTVLADFGTRSMQAYAIQYPYWENVARGWEDVLALILVLQMLCLFIPAGIGISVLMIGWKRRQWTLQEVYGLIVTCKEKVVQRLTAEKSKWKYF